jgi:hypothetical protein
MRFYLPVCKDTLGKSGKKAEYELQFYILGLIEHQRALAEAGYKFPKLEGKCPFCGGVVGETITSLIDGYGKEKPVYLYTCLNKACSCELYATHRYEYVS